MSGAATSGAELRALMFAALSEDWTAQQCQGLLAALDGCVLLLPEEAEKVRRVVVNFQLLTDYTDEWQAADEALALLGGTP